jgi:hypothetical protein
MGMMKQKLRIHMELSTYNMRMDPHKGRCEDGR